MAKLPALCDVPGCTARRARGQRLCRTCWCKLPGEIRVGINEAHHQRRMADWRALRVRAADMLKPAARTAPRVTPERSFEITAQRMGERS